MSRTHRALRGALLLGVAIVAGACNADTHIVLPVANNALFSSYVAIGNSITAGYQSGGINDSTQRQSYAALLAKQMGTRYAYPSLRNPGCAPPINNVLTGARVTPTGFPTSTATTCYYRDSAFVTATLNNVAVPGAASADPTAAVGPSQNTLTELFLGGETMIQKALDAKPTFVTVWIGNNDILGPALTGFPNGAPAVGTIPAAQPATTVATFITNYSKMIAQLTAGAPNVKGVLIGVVQVPLVPLMFQAGVLADPTARGAASQVAGRPVTLDATTCAGANAGALVNFQAIAAIAARPAAAGGAVYCQKILGGGALDPGDNGILDITEQATVAALINGYNTYIKAKADSIGFAYYDPSVRLAALKAAGSIPPFPNLASPTQPFGQYFSFDGVHPSGAAHVLIANDIILAINAKYSTTLAPSP